MRRTYLKTGTCLGARVALAAAALALLAAVPAVAANWKSAGPAGGFNRIAQAPSEPGRLYGGTSAAGGFGSLDGGRSWRPLPGLSGLAAPILEAVAVAPDDADTVYFFSHANEGDQLLRSRDGGAHFERLVNGLTSGATQFTALAIAPYDARILTLGTNDGVFQSDDGGDLLHSTSFSGQEIQGLAFDPNGPRNVIAVVNTGSSAPSVWLSRDGGLSWSVTAGPDGGFPFLRPVFDPVQIGTLYLVSGFRLFRSPDLGATWTEVPTGRNDITDVAVLSDGTLLAASFSGIYRSADGGAGWLSSGPEPASIRPAQPVFRIDPLSDGAAVGAFALGSSGLWRTDDGGETWSEASRGIRAHTVIGLEAGSAIYTNLDGAGVFRKTTATGPWVKTHPGTTLPLPGLDYSADHLRLLAVDPRNPNIALADFGSRLVQTRDGGLTWPTRLPATPDAFGLNINAAVFAPSNPKYAYVSALKLSSVDGAENTLWRSLNRGFTWEKVNAFGNLLALAVDPRNPKKLYAASNATFAVSENGGVSWQTIGRGLPTRISPSRSIRIDPGDPQHIYLSTRPGVWESRDGGTTFHHLGTNLGNVLVNRLALDASGLYASLPDRGIFRWNLTSRIWQPVGNRFPAANFSGTFVLDPHRPGRLWAATFGAGLFSLEPE
ncbi:MAG: hypothetical protein ABJC13_07420 [Acidobacteriota bacterium]